jgi:hypothetical protein
MYAEGRTDPTPSIARVVEFVRQFRQRYQFSPSGADIARGLRLERSWCTRVARQAVARGRLIHDAGVARSWRLPATPAAPAPAAATTTPPRKRRAN